MNSSYFFPQHGFRTPLHWSRVVNSSLLFIITHLRERESHLHTPPSSCRAHWDATQRDSECDASAHQHPREREYQSQHWWMLQSITQEDAPITNTQVPIKRLETQDYENNLCNYVLHTYTYSYILTSPEVSYDSLRSILTH